MTVMRLVPNTGTDRPAQQIAARVRAVMAENRYRGTEVAQAIGLKQPAFSRRYSGEVDWSIDELARLAEAFGVPFGDLCAIRDSNPEPADTASTAVRAVVLRLVGAPRPTVPAITTRVLGTLEIVQDGAA